MSETRAIQMRIVKYVPPDMYGFCSTGEGLDSFRIYFHLSQFDASGFAQQPPVPPVVGELVEVTVKEESFEGAPNGKAPKALRVTRLHTPTQVQGRVTRFDPVRGFGFIVGEDGKDYFLHRVEVLHGKLPGRGMDVMFNAGTSRGKHRACYVVILE